MRESPLDDGWREALRRGGDGRPSCWRRPSLSLIAGVKGRELRCGEDMPLHCLEHRAFGGALGQTEHNIESIKPEDVAMRSPGRARATITQFAKLILAFYTDVWPTGSFGKFGDLGRDVKLNPVHPSFGVGVIHDDYEADRVGRGALPSQRRGEVLSIALARVGKGIA